ncbi:AmmeMemoRadiSam system protein B [Ferrimonas marina]|uniref:MEMO1 family protein n=1 Tax=Ferrimonas marina TaxID=299255 RepID=A0A1M5VRB1_9GAMM|nr:AmmeMemoRadiSam system protein B [Ferrimonas marina]SHH77463.1 hypothetical protein SAMN02745129_2919 [Ferrimonas marina]
MSTRPSAVAGQFYPTEPMVLTTQLRDWLGAPAASIRPRALIVPHAGYRYSGAVAAKAYRLLAGHHYRHCWILGPAHTHPVEGICLPRWHAFATPLGELALADCPAFAGHPSLYRDNTPHAREHALEVQLPFVQLCLPNSPIVPLIVGYCPASEVAQLLTEGLSEQDLLIISTDLSHFLPLPQAQQRDQETLSRIQALDPHLGGQQACGAYPLAGALLWAKQQGLQPQLLDYATSADAGGDPDRVVGYAALTLH